jgi:transposase
MHDPTATPLPDDVETLKAMLRDAKARLDDTTSRLDDTTSRLDATMTRLDAAISRGNAAALKADQLAARTLKLEAALLKLRKLYYGPRADRFATVEQVDQLLLDFGSSLLERPVEPADVAEEDRPAVVEAGPQARTARVARRGRRNLRSGELEHLPERRVEHDLEPDRKACPCCGTQRCRVSTQESCVLEYVPGHFERILHVRHVYACKACDQAGEGAMMEAAPLAAGAKVFDRAMPGPGLLAFIASSKFSVYTPLHRLEELFDRDGVSISRGTMCVWMRDVADLLRPVYDLMAARVRLSGVVLTDDTVMPMQAAEKVKPARLWVYIGGPEQPYDVYDFTLSRSRDGPARFLAGFKGTLVADAYGGYDGVVADQGLTRAGCWAHARRKFVDAQGSAPAIAREAATLIGGLFAIEARIKDFDAAERTAARQRETVPLLATIESRLVAWRCELLPKHEMAQAVNDALNQWKELSVFAGDQRVPIDNNASERDMKRVVLNRKNSLFVGNERGGETAAILSSLTATCKRHGVDPQRYLTQALTNVPHASGADLERWLPDRWKAEQQSRRD